MKFILIVSLFVSSVVFARIYKYKDNHGRIHYVDDISKVPNNKVNYVKTLRSKFLKTGNKKIDKYRKLILKKGVYYKELEAQKIALLSWGSIMVSYGFPEFKVDLSRINSISFLDKKGRKLRKRKMRRLAVMLSNFFKSFENDWPKIYEEVHFKSSGDVSIDMMRKHSNTIKTTSGNLSARVKLLEDWSKIIENNKSSNFMIIKERIKNISAMYDVPKPNIDKLSKYIDNSIKIFEKEFRK